MSTWRVLLVDPVLDDREIQTLKQDPRTASIPVVVISNYPRTEIVPTEGFVGKPCSPDQIIAEVMRVVKDANRERGGPQCQPRGRPWTI